jgi:hypothetical protein
MDRGDFVSSRDKAVAVARAKIDGWLKSDIAFLGRLMKLMLSFNGSSKRKIESCGRDSQ